MTMESAYLKLLYFKLFDIYDGLDDLELSHDVVKCIGWVGYLIKADDDKREAKQKKQPEQREVRHSEAANGKQQDSQAVEAQGEPA